MNDGGPAFAHSGYYFNQVLNKEPQPGMSIRDYFAGQALMGMVANGQGIAGEEYEGKTLAEAFSDQAYAIADAMISERNKNA